MKRIAIATQRVRHNNKDVEMVLIVAMMMVRMMMMTSIQVLFLLECTILPKEDIQLNTRVTIYDHDYNKFASLKAMLV